MSANPEISQGPDFIEDLGLIVGIEEGCSISAAEAHETAHKIVSNHPVQSIYVIGDDPAMKRQGIAVDLQKNIELEDGRSANLSLIKAVNVFEVRTPYRKFLKKVIDIKYSHAPEDPLLCARFGEDAYLPIARFALEGSSEYCSYVQLGSEMTDDSVVMTTLDEKTSRQGKVEAIREIFKEYSNSSNSSAMDNPDALAIVRRLAIQQASIRTERLEEAQEAMLVRRCLEKIKDNAVPKTLNIIGENGIDYRQNMQVRPLLENCRLDDSRFVDLAICQGEGGKDVKIVAIARGDLAFTIATVIPETNKVVFEQPQANLNNKSRSTLIQTLLDRVRGEPLLSFERESIPKAVLRTDKAKATSSTIKDKWNDWSKRARNRFGGVPITDEEYFFDPSNYNYTVPATYLYRLGLLTKKEGALDDPHKAGMTEWGVTGTFESLDKLFKDPEKFGDGKLPWNCDYPPVWLALSRLPMLRRAEQKFFDEVGASKVMKDNLGDTTLTEERFIRQIQEMVAECSVYSVTTEDVNTGTNRASLDIEARLHKEGTEYRIDLYAKAHALKAQPFPDQPYRSLSFDTLRSLTDADPAERLEEIERFANTLSKLEPSNLIK